MGEGMEFFPPKADGNMVGGSITQNDFHNRDIAGMDLVGQEASAERGNQLAVPGGCKQGLGDENTYK